MQMRTNPLFLIFVLIPGMLWSQTKPDAPKIKPPKMDTYWGVSSSGNLTVVQVLPLLDSTLNVYVEKKEKQVIAKAILIYRSKDFYEDESTGTIKTRFNSYSYTYQYNGTLPDNWKKFLKENLSHINERYIRFFLLMNAVILLILTYATENRIFTILNLLLSISLFTYTPKTHVVLDK
jgi:hypothetical protein